LRILNCLFKNTKIINYYTGVALIYINNPRNSCLKLIKNDERMLSFNDKLPIMIVD